MKKIILILSIFFSGSIMAQTFDFSCETTDLEILQDLEGITVDESNFPFNGGNYYIGLGNAPEVSFTSSEQAVRAARFVVDLGTQDLTVAQVIAGLESLVTELESTALNQQARPKLLALADNLYYLISVQGDISNLLSNSLECRISDIRAIFTSNGLGVGAFADDSFKAYFELSITHLGEIDCPAPADSQANSDLQLMLDFVGIPTTNTNKRVSTRKTFETLTLTATFFDSEDKKYVVLNSNGLGDGKCYKNNVLVTRNVSYEFHDEDYVIPAGANTITEAGTDYIGDEYNSADTREGVLKIISDNEVVYYIVTSEERVTSFERALDQVVNTTLLLNSHGVFDDQLDGQYPANDNFIQDCGITFVLEDNVTFTYEDIRNPIVFNYENDDSSYMLDGFPFYILDDFRTKEEISINLSGGYDSYDPVRDLRAELSRRHAELMDPEALAVLADEIIADYNDSNFDNINSNIILLIEQLKIVKIYHKVGNQGNNYFTGNQGGRISNVPGATGNLIAAEDLNDYIRDLGL